MAEELTDSKILSLVNWVAEKGIEGIRPMSSAQELANEYKANPAYSSTEERIDALIRWETTKGTVEGFITGVGGVLNLPVAIASITSSMALVWVYQARLAASIAILAGYPLTSSQIKTLILLCLAGGSVEKLLKGVSCQIGEKITLNMIKRIPGRVLTAINRAVGFRLITKFGTKGVINLGRLIPGVGGAIGAIMDGTACRAAGKAAKKMFFVDKVKI